jgi:phosphoribosylformimino-5-aminoimidazole carboxamide ribotide isomerase
MIIYPAIDIKGGKCVRLQQGKADEETVFGEDPVQMALAWEEQGAEFIHLVDLDGAFEGHSSNLSIIAQLARRVSVPIQLGGGIRTMDRVIMLLEEYGIARVILGTAALESPKLVEEAVKRYGNRIAAGIDAKRGKAAIRGWVQKTDIEAVELGRRMKSMGIDTVIYTDIARDGMMAGPNLRETRAMIDGTGLDIIASGGVSSLEDVRNVKGIGAAGVIVGRALYTGAISLTEALKV